MHVCKSSKFDMVLISKYFELHVQLYCFDPVCIHTIVPGIYWNCVYVLDIILSFVSPSF